LISLSKNNIFNRCTSKMPSPSRRIWIMIGPFFSKIWSNAKIIIFNCYNTTRKLFIKKNKKIYKCSYKIKSNSTNVIWAKSVHYVSKWTKRKLKFSKNMKEMLRYLNKLLSWLKELGPEYCKFVNIPSTSANPLTRSS